MPFFSKVSGLPVTCSDSIELTSMPPGDNSPVVADGTDGVYDMRVPSHFTSVKKVACLPARNGDATRTSLRNSESRSSFLKVGGHGNPSLSRSLKTLPLAVDDNSETVSLPSTTFNVQSDTGTPCHDRQGWSEDQCRRVLIRYCQHIPRNYQYADGVHEVYQILRTHLGDENLDLSIGVLHELIEVDTTFTWEEGAAFKRWQFDHSLRTINLENSHCPRLKDVSVIVGQIIPTAKLQVWRALYPERQRGLSSSSASSSKPSEDTKPHYGLHGRSVWQIENTFFVSSKYGGTRIYYCPTPEELHRRTWDEEIGRGGKLITFAKPIQEELSHWTAKRPATNILDTQQSICSTRKRLSTGLPFQNQKLENKSGDTVSNQYLWGAAKGPNSAFARKHGLTPELLNEPEISIETLSVSLSEGAIGSDFVYRDGWRSWRENHLLPAPMSKTSTEHIGKANVIADMPCAEALAIDRNLRILQCSEETGVDYKISGPFTSSLFLDGFLDFDWKPSSTPLIGINTFLLSSSEYNSKISNRKAKVVLGMLNLDD